MRNNTGEDAGHGARVNAIERTHWVCEQASEMGFDLCGVAPVEGLEDLHHFPEWLARGYAADMNYLRDALRGNPRLVLPGARSLVVVALNYNSPQPYSTKHSAHAVGEPARGWISR